MDTGVERDCSRLLERGVSEPFPLLDRYAVAAVDCGGARFAESLRRRRTELGIADFAAYLRQIAPGMPWMKSAHVHVPEIAAVASRQEILARVSRLLGKQIVLWGAHWVRRDPGEVHRWHADVEALEWPTVNVWIGLVNVTTSNGLRVVAGTHHLPPVQLLAAREGLPVDDDRAVLAAASRLARRACPARAMPMNSGDAVVFDGRVWHSSRNDSPSPRSALLLQFSPASAAVRIPVTFDPPVEWHPDPPPCVPMPLSE